MVFKLVRTDTAEPCKIQLPIGKHLIGRGKLLDCEDKRVSRNHGELEVVDDKVVIKALHQNPCFIIRKGTADTQILKQNCSSNISNGDKFGLLPDSYWYELLHCVDIDNESDYQPSIVTTAQVKQETNEEREESKGVDTEPLDGSNGDSRNNSECLDVNLNETIENNTPDSPSLLAAENEQAADAESEQATRICSSEGNTQHTDNYELNENAQDEEPIPFKRCHSQDDSSDTVKKIKTEPEIKEEADDAQAGPSNDHNDSNSDDKADLKPVQPLVNGALRERCMYGASCYRRNPQHKAQFSHPADADWGAGPQAPCPFGATCRRRDPRHWRDHVHPPAAAPPGPQPHAQQHDAGQKKRKPKPKKLDNSDDEDTPTLGLIVQGKRVRKTVPIVNSWSGSESDKEEDPYGTDESDEWQPSSNMTDSQFYSQDL